jgi:rhomboid protease GluP
VLAFYLRKHTAIPPSIINQQRWSGVAFIGFNLMNGFSHSGIDNAAHIGGLSVGFVMGLVLARPLDLQARAQINLATFYTRGCITASIMIGLLFVALQFSPAGNAADQQFRRDLLSMAKSEAIAQQSSKEAFEGLRNHQLTEREFAARIDSDVLPRWVMIQKAFERDRVADNSQLKPLWELLNDFSASRLAAYQLFESAGRTGNTTDFKRAQEKVDQGNIDLKLIRDLNQNRQQ